VTVSVSNRVRKEAFPQSHSSPAPLLLWCWILELISTMKVIAFLALLLLHIDSGLAGTTVIQVTASCCLCNYCSPPPASRGSVFVTSTSTCNMMALYMANPSNMSPGTPTCTEYQQTYRSQCCSASAATAPAPAPTTVEKTGPYEVCHVCPSGRVPSNVNAFTSVLFIPGSNTCGQLFNLGLTGNIPTAMCPSLQTFMRTPCGCY